MLSRLGAAWLAASLSLVLLIYGKTACAQLNAPGAFDDFAACKQLTCIWVPAEADKTFQQGEFSYTVHLSPNENGGDFVLRRGKRTLLQTPLKDLSASVSVVWSPDKQSFAVTWSDGGAIGGFHVRAFRTKGDSVEELNATKKAFLHFRSRHWCKTRGDNIQAYGWSSDSKSLVLVLSVYPTSDCGADLGHMEGYLVDAVSGQIIENWNLKRLKLYMRQHPEL